MKLQLTYIPAEYWNEKASEFTLIPQASSLPKNASFFLLWMPSNGNQTKNLEELINQIRLEFQNIPIEKLLTCKIRLAYPFNLKEAKIERNMSNEFFNVSSVFGKIMPIGPSINLLYQLQILQNKDRNIKHYSNSIKTWAFLTKFIHELLNKGQFVPLLEKLTEKQYIGKWHLLLKSQQDNLRFKSIITNTSWMAHNLPINFIIENGGLKTDGLWHPSFLFSKFMDHVGDYLIRLLLNKNKFQTFGEYYKKEIQKEKDKELLVIWDYKFLKSIIRKNNKFEINQFHEIIIPKIISNWVQSTQGFTFNRFFSFILELNYPKGSEEEWSLKFQLKLQDSPSLTSLKEIWQGQKSINKKLAKFFDTKEQYMEVILRALGTASKLFPPIERALESKNPHEVILSSSEVMSFLKYPKDLLIQSGFGIKLPEVFTTGGKQRLSAKLVIRSKDKSPMKEKKGIISALPSMFTADSMLDYKWEATLENEKLTEKEFKSLINSSESLINWRGKWVLIDQGDVSDLQNIFEKNEISGTKSYMEALKLGLAGFQSPESSNRYEVVMEGSFSEIFNRLQSMDSFEAIPCPTSFQGTLRPYQQTALTWMGNMCALNFGVCLADDMGLGKTIQVLSYLLFRKENYTIESGSTLIICPTSVLFNWMREIKKFAPDLKIILHHGPNRVKTLKKIPELIHPHSIILTSYGTIRNDIDLLETIQFSGVIVDESQNMKNFATQQTQAINKLQSQFRICLSGTPIENRLIELWTLFNFLNPNLLGKKSEFQKKFMLPIERFQDHDVIEKLKLLIQPFILRRMKSDKKVISDLPEKNEIKVYLELTDEQKKMYEELVQKSLNEIDNNSSDKRKTRGLILKLITQLKQVTNHPYHFLKKTDVKTDVDDFVSKSNKIKRLLEIVEKVLANGEKILIFTQFRQMGDLIQKLLELKYNNSILYFHGSVPEKKRREIVDEFQSEDMKSSPILILSLKAGGTGLNLIRGTTVVHFDRFWNPAVEDQATDRAYRIGQKSKVNAYKFITVGTIEEKIDLLLEEKRDLADKIIVSSGESWVSDLNREKLKELFLLNS